MLDSEKSWLAGALEAMLFVTDEPVTVLTFADMLEAEPAIIQETLEELQRSLEHDERGIQLREVAGGWRLYSHPRYHELIEKYVLSAFSSCIRDACGGGVLSAYNAQWGCFGSRSKF